MKLLTELLAKLLMYEIQLLLKLLRIKLELLVKLSRWTS